MSSLSPVSLRVVVLCSALIVGGGALVACPGSKTDTTTTTTTTTDGADVYARTQQALNARLAAIHDVDVEGQIVDAAGQALRFRYAMQQPAFTAGELLGPDGARARAFVFDGKHLAMIDDGSKTAMRQDLSVDEQGMLLTLHQVFSPFVCEGWRPPLLKPSGVQAVAEGEQVVLTVPVGEGGVKHQRVVLGPKGAFVSKQTVGDDGAVLAETMVLESATDEKTGLAFPIRWSLLEGGQKATVTLSSWKVNAGVPAARFDTQTPSGYTERTP